MAPNLYTAAAVAASQPGPAVVALDWLTAHPVVAGVLLGLAGLTSHFSSCTKCRSRLRKRRARKAAARARIFGGRAE